MKYYIFAIDDSGAVEDIDEKIVNSKSIPFCKIYDDTEFNKLNDILHSTNEFIINAKALIIFKESNIIPFKLCQSIEKRKSVRIFKKI